MEVGMATTADPYNAYHFGASCEDCRADAEADAEAEFLQACE